MIDKEWVYNRQKIVEQFQNKKNPYVNNVYSNLKLDFVQGRNHQAD